MDQQIQPDVDQVAELHPADIADRLQRLPEDEALALLRQLPAEIGAETLSETEEESRIDLIDAVGDDALAAFLREMPPNEATDILGDVSLARQNRLLSLLPHEHAEDIRVLLRYPVDTAGGIMTDRFIALRADQTIQSSLDDLRARFGRGYQEAGREDVAYLYVTDKADHLIGIVSIRDLVFGSPESKIGDIMRRDVTVVRLDDDQEEIARKFKHYHFLGLPVVDRSNRLAGVIRASDAMEIASDEATEDMQLMVGLSGEERALTPWQKSIGQRLPWLYINLATAFLAGAVVGLFEDTIAQWTALAVFLPVVAGQGGNAGMQTLTVIIRDMALGELSPGDGRRALIKEVTLGLINGLAVGLVVGAVGFLWKGNLTLGLVAGTAMLLNQLAAALSGVLIPFGLKWIKVDPALASSILLTTVTDVMGFFFFLGLGAAALHFLG